MVENEKLQMGLWSMTNKEKTYVKETCPSITLFTTSATLSEMGPDSVRRLSTGATAQPEQMM